GRSGRDWCASSINPAVGSQAGDDRAWGTVKNAQSICLLAWMGWNADIEGRGLGELCTYDKIATESLSEYELKKILFDKIDKSLFFMTHDKYQELYDALLNSVCLDEAIASSEVNPDKVLRIRHRDKDQDPPTGSDKEKKRSRKRKDYEPSKDKVQTGSSSKGKTQSKPSSTGKSVNADETIEEQVHEDAMDVAEPILDDVVNDADQPQDDVDPKKDKSTWFKQPPRPETPDLELHKDRFVDDGPEQTWFNDLVNANKDSLTFDELMVTPMDFIKFSMNCLKKDKITRANLVGPVYKLLKGTCKSNRCPYDLSKPLPLQGSLGHLTIPVDFFFNNDLEYLKTGNSERKYTVSITKTKAARSQINRISKHKFFYTIKILSVIRVKVDKQFGYGYLEEIVVRRADQKEYTFKEGDFSRLHLNDIEDMLLLHVQNKLFNLPGDDIIDLVIVLRMFTRSLVVIKKRVEDVQLRVESYQKKLNITKPQK
ncbi:hypothetical protein Tco_0848288, partial [Tanacetum coccineum]